MKEKTGASMESFKLPFAIAAAFILLFTGDAFATRDMTNYINRPPSLNLSVAIVWLGSISLAMSIYFVDHWRSPDVTIQRRWIYVAIASVLPLLAFVLPGGLHWGSWHGTMLWCLALCAVTLLSHLTNNAIERGVVQKVSIYNALLISVLLLSLFAYYCYLFGSRRFQEFSIRTAITIGYVIIHSTAAHLILWPSPKPPSEKRWFDSLFIILLVALDIWMLFNARNEYRTEIRIGSIFAFYALPYCLYQIVIKFSEQARMKASMGILIVVTVTFIGTMIATDYMRKALTPVNESHLLKLKDVGKIKPTICFT